MNDHIEESNGMVCPRCGCGHPMLAATGRIYECGTLVESVGSSKSIIRKSTQCHIIENLKAHVARLESIGDAMRPWCNDPKSCEDWDKAKEDKP